MKKQSIKEVAYHEAGHLVAAIIFNMKSDCATIIRNEEAGSLGHVINDNFNEYADISDKWHQALLTRHIISHLSGYLAQRKYYPNADRIGAIKDEMSAIDCLNKMYTRFPKKYYIDGEDRYDIFLQARYEPKAEKFVNDHWEQIEYTAKLLLKKKTLNQDDIKALTPIIKKWK